MCLVIYTGRVATAQQDFLEEWKIHQPGNKHKKMRSQRDSPSFFISTRVLAFYTHVPVF